MSTNINFVNSEGLESDTRIDFNLPRTILLKSEGRAVADGAVIEGELCAYNALNALSKIIVPTFAADPATLAYLAATGITGATEVAAINNLVVGLKADGLWSKMKAVYPFVTDQRNLASYTEGSSVGYSTSCTSITSTTELSPNNTNTAVRLTRLCALNPYVFQTFTLAANTIYTFSVYMRCPTGNTVVNLNIDSANGSLGIGNVNVNLTTSWQRYSYTFNTLAYSNNFLTVIKNLSTSIDFWGWQLEIGSTATAYQPQLGSAQSAIANQFKYNLVNPVDSDAAFRLVFNGGWTHSSTGATPNGTNGYADTKFIPSSNVTLSSFCFSAYSRTPNGVDYRLWGILNSSLNYWTYMSSRTLSVDNANNMNSFADLVSLPTDLGLRMSNRNSLTQYKVIQNTTSNTIVSTANQLAQISFYFGGANGYANYSKQQIAFGHLSDGLTDTEASNLYTRVQAYQTALSRQV